MTHKNVMKDIPYGEHERHKLDIYFPDKIKCNSGLIFYIHGGGWTSADKSVHQPDCEHFCSLGYICASMNYRYVDGNITIFEELDDIKDALETVKKICCQKGIAVTKVLLAGGSAGASGRGQEADRFPYSQRRGGSAQSALPSGRRGKRGVRPRGNDRDCHRGCQDSRNASSV